MLVRRFEHTANCAMVRAHAKIEMLTWISELLSIAATSRAARIDCPPRWKKSSWIPIGRNAQQLLPDGHEPAFCVGACSDDLRAAQ